MLYPWPMADYFIPDEALRIAMDYLERTGKANEYTRVQSQAANAIVARWRTGVANKIRLANYAINAVEKPVPIPQNFGSFYPWVS